MHILIGTLAGLAIWIAAMVFASATMFAVLSGPFIVSGTALILAMIPEINWRRPWTATQAAVLACSMLVVVGALFAL